MKRGKNDAGGQDNLKYRVAVSNIPPYTSPEELDYLLTFLFKTTSLNVQSLRQDDPGKPKRATLFCNLQSEAVNVKTTLDKMPYNGYILSAFLIGYTAPSSDSPSYINPEKTRKLDSRFNCDDQSNDPWVSKLSNQGHPNISNEFGQLVSANRGQSNMFANVNVVNTPSSEFRRSDYGNLEQNQFGASDFGSKVVPSSFPQTHSKDFRKATYAEAHEKIREGFRDFNQSKSLNSGRSNDLRRSYRDSMDEPQHTDYNVEAEIKKFRESHNVNDMKQNIHKFRDYDANIVAQINKIQESNNINPGSKGFFGADSMTRSATTKFPDEKYREGTLSRFSAPDSETPSTKYTPHQTDSENWGRQDECRDFNFGEQDFQGSKFIHDRQWNEFQESYSSGHGSNNLRVSDSVHCAPGTRKDNQNFARTPFDDFDKTEFQKQASDVLRRSDAVNRSSTFELCGSNISKYIEQVKSKQLEGSNFGNQDSNAFRQYNSMNFDSETESQISNFQKDPSFINFSQSNFEKQTSMNDLRDLKFAKDGANVFRQFDSERRGLSTEFDNPNFGEEHQLYARREPNTANKKSDVVRRTDSFNRNPSKDTRNSRSYNNQSLSKDLRWHSDKEDGMSKDLIRSNKGNNKRSMQSKEEVSEVSFDAIMKQVEMRKKMMEQQNLSQKMQQTNKSVVTPQNRAKKFSTQTKNIEHRDSKEKLEQIQPKTLPGLMDNIVEKLTPLKKISEQNQNEKPKEISRKSLPPSSGKPIQKVDEKKKNAERKKSRPKVRSEGKGKLLGKDEPSFLKSGGWSALGPPKKLPSEELGQKILIEQAILVLLKQHEDILETMHVYKGIWEGCLDIAKGEISDKLYELIGERRMASVEEAIELYRKSVPRRRDREIISEARRRLGTRVFGAEPFGRYMDSKEEAELRQVMQIEELNDPYSVISNLADDNCWYVDYQLDKILSKVYQQNVLKPDEEDPFKDITLKTLQQKVLFKKDMPAVERFIDHHLARLVPKIKEYMMESINTVETPYSWLPPMIYGRAVQAGVSLLPHEQSQREMHHLGVVSKASSLRKLLKPYQISAVRQIQSTTHSGALLTLTNGMQFEDLLCRNGCIFDGQKFLIYPVEEKTEEGGLDEKSDSEDYSDYDSAESSSYSSRGSSPYYPWEKYSSRESSPDVKDVNNVDVIEID